MRDCSGTYIICRFSKKSKRICVESPFLGGNPLVLLRRDAYSLTFLRLSFSSFGEISPARANAFLVSIGPTSS